MQMPPGALSLFSCVFSRTGEGSLLLCENSLVTFAHGRGAASKSTRAGILSFLCTLRQQTT